MDVQMMVENYRGLENLEIWKRSMKFAVELCKELLSLFPQDEKFALVAQLRRAVQSIPANIAEGYGRYYFQEGIPYSYIARGSLEEIYSHLAVAYHLQYLSKEKYQEFTSEIGEIRKLLNGYIAYLKRSKRGEKEPGNIYQNNETGNPVNYDFGPDGFPQEDES